MIDEKIISKLGGITKIRQNADIGKNSWIGCGGTAELLIMPQNLEQLQKSIEILHSENISIQTIGARSNAIISDKLHPGAFVWLKGDLCTAKILKNHQIFAGAGCLDYNFAHFCMENSIANFEFLIGIPGTIGGNIVMNAGCYNSEISQFLESIEYVDFTGKYQKIATKDVTFKYRKAHLPQDIIITSCVLNGKLGDTKEILAKMDEITEKRNKTQPIGRKTVGSTFKNPQIFTQKSFELICSHFGKTFEYTEQDSQIFCDKIHSWMLIDATELRSKTIGGAGISDIHCNFLINIGNATSQDFIDLGNFIIKKVEEKFQITLEWEVKII